MEVWKEIEGFDKGYKVSNLGNVFSEKTNKILKPTKDRGGYRIVGLYKNKKRHFQKVHRLVAKAFIENPNEYPQVNHIDCCNTNNKADNLEWCTAMYNTQSVNSTKNIGCVYFDKSNNRWRFIININGKRTQKNFETQEEADSYRVRYIASL